MFVDGFSACYITTIINTTTNNNNNNSVKLNFLTTTFFFISFLILIQRFHFSFVSAFHLESVLSSICGRARVGTGSLCRASNTR